MRQALITALLGAVADSGVTVNAELEERFTRIISEYHVERTGTEVAVVEPGLPKAARDYLVSRSIEGLSEATLKNYHNALLRFFTEVRRPFEQIDATTIKLWLYNLQKTGISMRSVAHYRTVLSTFYDWCEDNDIIAKAPTRKIATIRFDKPQHHALTSEELLSIREACKNVRERALIELLYSTGCRVGELVAMRRSDIDLEGRTAQAHNFKSKRSKTVYLSDACAFWLKRYFDTLPSDSDVLFPSQKSGGTSGIGIAQVEGILRGIGERAGLPNGRLHPHILRHTLATDIVTGGGSLADAQQILDHAKPETTLIYAEMSKQQLKEIHRRCAA